MIEQKQGHHHKQTNSQPMRGEEMTQQPPGWGGQSSRELMCTAASSQLSSTLNMALPQRLSQVSAMMSVNEGLRVPPPPTPTKSTQRVETDFRHMIQVQTTDHRSVQRMCCCSPCGMFVF